MASKPEVLAWRRINDPDFVERCRKYSKAYRERNREKERERQRKSKEKSRFTDREAYNAYAREWRNKNKDRVNAARRERIKSDAEYAEMVRARERAHYAKNAHKHRNVRLRSVYGISIEKYMEMYGSQNGKCALCSVSKPPHGKDGLYVDHCHNTGNVRKLLCASCNSALGHMKDDVEIMRKAIDYITQFNS